MGRVEAHLDLGRLEGGDGAGEGGCDASHVEDSVCVCKRGGVCAGLEIRRAAEAYLYSLFWGGGESLKSPRSSPASRRAARMIVQRSLKMTNEKSQYGLDDVLWTYALDGMPKVSMSLHLSYPFLPFVSPPSSSAAASDLCVTVQKWRFFPFPPRTFSSASLHSSAHNPKTHTPPHHLFQQWLASLPPSPAPSPPSRRPRSRCASSPSPRNVPHFPAGGVFFPKV